MFICKHDGLPADAPLGSASIDCIMKVSLAYTRGEVAARKIDPRLLKRVPLQLRRMPRFAQWHVTTQDRLFSHLRTLWSNDEPRVMVDLGCHAGLSRHQNVSDALLWLDQFHAPGSLVVGVDAKEDWAADLQYRFDYVEPYASTGHVTKRAYTRWLSDRDDMQHDNTDGARQQLGCCLGLEKWCSKLAVEQQGSDHLCRITRQRMRASESERDRPDARVLRWKWEHPPELMSRLLEHRQKRGLYLVRSERADTLWQRELSGRTIDFLKVDTDTSWKLMGLEGLLVDDETIECRSTCPCPKAVRIASPR